MKHLKLIINNDIKNNSNNYFIKKELKLILNLYAQMVSQGYCKDYGLSIVRWVFLLIFTKDHLKTNHKNS